MIHILPYLGSEECVESEYCLRREASVMWSGRCAEGRGLDGVYEVTQE